MKNARIFVVNGTVRTRPPKDPSPPLTTLPAMAIGAWGDPHMYIRVTAPDPNNRLISTQVATWGDNKDGSSGNNELLLVELQTSTDTIKVFYTNKTWSNLAKVVANVRVEYNGVSTTYTDTARVVRNPLVLNIFKMGSGVNTYLSFDISWAKINNVVKLGGAIVPILKRVADNNGRPWNGGDGLKWDGFGKALAVYGLTRSSFETGMGIMSQQEDLVLSVDESNFLDTMISSAFVQPSNIFDNTENLGENGEGNGAPVDQWDDTYNDNLAVFSSEGGLSGVVDSVLATTTTTTTTAAPTTTTTTTTTAAPTTTTTTTAAPTTTTTTAAPTTTTTASPTTTTTTTTTTAPQGLSVVSGSTSGDGTSASPYLVASDTSPSPIYEANTPGLLTVNFTTIRTGSYNCDKSGCQTGRYNESVYFDRNDGNFYEQIRTNIDNFTTSIYIGNEAFIQRASRNTLTSISYPMHKGQRLRMSQHSVFGSDSISAPDNNRQLTNARISFTPLNNPNFSISYVGTRGVIGNGTPSNPYISSTNFSSQPNERTHSFRANGDGIIALFGFKFGYTVQRVAPFDSPNIYVGGSANSFSGARALGKLDFFNFPGSLYNSIRRPNLLTGSFAVPRYNLFKVTDGQIFSFAEETNGKSGIYIQERSVDNYNFKPMFCCVPNNSSDVGIWLMNTNISQTQVEWHPSNTWNGQGTQNDPANMNSFSSGGGIINTYLLMNGTISFNYQITNNIPVTVTRSFGPGYNPNGVSYERTVLSTLANSSGSLTLSVKAFTGVNFVPNQICGKSYCTSASFKITNLVFTPS